MTEVKIACHNCAGHVEFPQSMMGEVISCPHCGLSLVLDLPGFKRDEPPQMARIKSASEFAGVGCWVQAMGLAVMVAAILFWPAALVGLALLIIGGRLALKYKCSHCGNLVASKSAKVCGACRRVFQ